MANRLGLQPADGPCFGLNWMADPGQTVIVGTAWDGSRHLYRQQDQPGTVRHVRQVALAPPPLVWPPMDESEMCWRCESAPGDHGLELCGPCHEDLKR